MTARVVTPADARRLLGSLESSREAMIALLIELIQEAGADTARQRLERIAKALRSVGMRVSVAPSNDTTHLVGHAGRRAAGPCQVVIGQVGSRSGAAKRTDGEVEGPEAHHLGGVVQAVFALWALSESEVMPPVRPVMLVLSDTGDPAGLVRAVGRNTDRIFVVGPSADGRIVTARPGSVTLVFTGVGDRVAAARSALKDSIAESGDHGDASGIKVRPGAHHEVGVTSWSAAAIQEAIDEAESAATQAGVDLSIDGLVPPMDRTNGARVLWWRAVAAAGDLGLGLAECISNETSAANVAGTLGPTLDGVGAIGATTPKRDWVNTDVMAERAALLARLLVDPPLSDVVCAE